MRNLIRKKRTCIASLVRSIIDVHCLGYMDLIGHANKEEMRHASSGWPPALAQTQVCGCLGRPTSWEKPVIALL